MNRSSVAFAALAVAAGAVLTPPLAQAQSYGGAYGGQPPLYPYAVQADQPYAIEVAPNTYVIQRPAASRVYPYLRNANGTRHHGVVETKKVVHEKPVVIETRRVVDDPPRVIERRHYVEDAPAASAAARQNPAVAEARVTGNIGKRGDDKLRVIHAEAEVTILGPDRMSIRLYRKRAGGDAKARAE